jgi:hypothetical protein
MKKCGKLDLWSDDEADALPVPPAGKYELLTERVVSTKAHSCRRCTRSISNIQKQGVEPRYFFCRECTPSLEEDDA